MIVIDPNNSVHEAVLIPRIYTSDCDIFYVTDEDNRTVTELNHSKVISNGFAIYQFTLNTSEGKSYSIKITNESGVVWRGKMFVTSQVKQKYKING